jgi:hypothetical protein
VQIEKSEEHKLPHDRKKSFFPLKRGNESVKMQQRDEWDYVN